MVDRRTRTSRPGDVVLVDTTDLPAALVTDMKLHPGEAERGLRLIVAVDAYTRCILGYSLT